MTIFFTSDLHFGHENIIKYCDRPFDSVYHMNEVLVENYNKVVKPYDTCFFLGDIAMGNWQENIKWISYMRGIKYLIPGNHDRCHPMFSGKEKYTSHYNEYARHFSAIFTTNPHIFYESDCSLVKYTMSHFPSKGKANDIRHLDWFIEDDFKSRVVPHLHGHLHSTMLKRVNEHNIDVGVDAWNYCPVSMEEIDREISLWMNQ